MKIRYRIAVILICMGSGIYDLLPAQEFPLDPAKVVAAWNYQQLVSELGTGKEIVDTAYGQPYLAGYQYQQKWFGKKTSVSFYFSDHDISRFIVRINHPMIWGSPSTDVKLPEDPDKRDSVLRAKQAEDSVWSAYLRSHPQIVDSLVHIAAKKLNLKQHAIVLQDSLRCDTLIRQINAIMGQPIIRDSVRGSINGFLFEATWINHGFGCSLRDYIDRTEIVFSMAPAPDRIIGMYDLPRQTITIRKNLVSTAKELISLSLLGVPSKNRSLYMEQLFLLVEHADGRIFFEQLPEETGSGFQPEYQIVELTGDSTPEVIIHAATGGSGGCVNFFIYSLAYEEPVLLLEPQEDGPEISGSFQSGFQAKIILPDESSQTVRLNRQQYDYSMVYQKDGTLVKPVDIWLGCLQDMTVGDVNPNGSHNLISVYQVKGICNANTIALLKVKWRYSSESWDPVNFTIINNN